MVKVGMVALQPHEIRDPATLARLCPAELKVKPGALPRDEAHDFQSHDIILENLSNDF